MLWLALLLLLIAWILGIAGTLQIGALVWVLLAAVFLLVAIEIVREHSSVR
jgi:uncharacterized protein (DUF58 family)